jgi:type I restriction enzyme S subunit
MATSGPTIRETIAFTKDGEWGAGEPGVGLMRMRVIRGTDFETARFGDLDRVPTRFIPVDQGERKRLRPWDVLIETAGGSKDRPTGRTLLVTPSLLEKAGAPVVCASFARVLRFDTDLVDPRYMYWTLQDMYNAGLMEQHQVQHTGVARFQFTRFAETVRVPLPALPVQRRIAAILGALDEKIDLNRRMNRTLEDMAQALFKSWFIDFDGHTDLVESEVGLIPRGGEGQAAR